MQPAIAQCIEKERARQAMLQAAGRMRRFVFEVKINTCCVEARQWQRNQMRIGTALKIRFDFLDGLVRPVALFACHDEIVAAVLLLLRLHASGLKEGEAMVEKERSTGKLTLASS